MAVFRDFYRVLMRGFFASIVCVFATFCTTFSANADTCENGGTLTQYVLGMPSSQFQSSWWGASPSTVGGTTDTYQDTNQYPSYGDVVFEHRCSTTNGNVGVVGNPSSNQGKYCWCRVKKYRPLNASSPELLNDMPWVFMGELGDFYDCNTNIPTDEGCMHTCSKTPPTNSSILQALYTVSQCEYTVTYHSNNGYDMSSINDYYTSCATAANANSIADSEHPVADIPYNVLSDGSNALSGLFSNAGSAYNNGCLNFVGWIDSSLHYYAKSSNTSCGTINSYPASNLDLYAVCSPARYAVYYHKGNCGGSDGAFGDNGMARYAFNYTVKSIDDINTITVPSGATFAGWTDQNGTGPYQGNYTVPCLSANGEIHFYGVCNQPSQPQSYTITYDKGGDFDIENMPGDQVVNSDDSNFLADGPTADGYNFVGWICDYNLDTGENIPMGYLAGQQFNFVIPTDGASLITCVAQWQQNISCSPGELVTYLLGQEEGQENWERFLEMINQDGPVELSEISDEGGNIDFVSGTITYGSMCSKTPGIPYVSGDPEEGEEKYCWCRVKNYDGYDGDVLDESVAPWVFAGYAEDCENKCSELCRTSIAENKDMRTSMFTTYDGCRYTVSYSFGNQCPSTFNVASQGVEAGTVYQLAIVPTAIGYTVSGWDCGNTAVNNNLITMPSNNVTCTASCNCATGYTMQNGSCVLNTYQIEYLPGASNDQVTGMPSTNPITNLEAGHQYYFAAAPTRTNYDFIGWDCSPSPTGVTPQENGYFAAADSFTMPAASITCTAQWKLNYDFSIVYVLGTPANAHGSSGAPSQTNCNYNETCYLADAPSAETGWVFRGWSCSPSLTGTSQTNGYFAGGAPITYSGNNNMVLCTAHWGCDSGYILDNQQCVQGYIIEYASGANDYDGMSVSGLPAQDTFPAGASYQLSSTEPSADGYIFVGWTCSYNLPGNEGANLCGEGMCSAGAEIAQMPAANVTCTARWRKNNYTITYNCGDHGDFIVPGTYANEPHSKTVAYNGPYTIDSASSVCTPINTSNSRFALNDNGTNIIAGGWKCKANGAASYLNSDSGDHWLYDADYTCTAQWINVYQIAYYSGNCGDPSYDGWKRRDIRANDTAIFGQSYTVQLPSSSILQPTGNLPLTHYIEGLENCVQFVGYYDGMGAENIDFPCGDSSCGSFYPNSYQGIEIDSNDGSLSLYMHCNWVTYPIIYHSCDGNSTYTGDVRAAYHYGVNVESYADTGLTLPDGYTFNGWATTSGATTSDVGATYTMPDCSPDGTVVNLYAVCSQNTPDSYTLHYVVNPGGITYTNEPDLDDVSVQVGGGHSLTVVPTAIGYTCSNWVCTYQNDGSNVVLAQPSGSITMPSADVTCTSNCTSNTVYLHWNPNGGSVNQSLLSPSCTYLDPTGIQLNATPIQNGYTFNGWVVTDYFPGLSAWNSSTNGSAYAFRGTEGYSGSANNISDYHWFNDYYSNPAESTWAVFFYNSDHSNFIMGQSGCSTESGPAQYAVGSPNIDNTNSNSVYCWCRVTSYVYDLVEVTQQSYPWVYLSQDSNNCKKFCAGSCALNVSNNPTFRVALYGQTE